MKTEFGVARLTLYVAGPITGLPDGNRAAFDQATLRLIDAGFWAVNPRELGDEGEHPWRWYMQRGLEALMRCDGVALLDGWEKSRGATLERKVAKALGMPVAPVDGWLVRS